MLDEYINVVVCGMQDEPSDLYVFLFFFIFIFILANILMCSRKEIIKFDRMEFVKVMC